MRPLFIGGSLFCRSVEIRGCVSRRPIELCSHIREQLFVSIKVFKIERGFRISVVRVVFWGTWPVRERAVEQSHSHPWVHGCHGSVCLPHCFCGGGNGPDHFLHIGPAILRQRKGNASLSTGQSCYLDQSLFHLSCVGWIAPEPLKCAAQGTKRIPYRVLVDDRRSLGTRRHVAHNAAPLPRAIGTILTPLGAVEVVLKVPQSSINLRRFSNRSPRR